MVRIVRVVMVVMVVMVDRMFRVVTVVRVVRMIMVVKMVKMVMVVTVVRMVRVVRVVLDGRSVPGDLKLKSESPPPPQEVIELEWKMAGEKVQQDENAVGSSSCLCGGAAASNKPINVACGAHTPLHFSCMTNTHT